MQVSSSAQAISELLVISQDRKFRGKGFYKDFKKAQYDPSDL